MRSMRVIFRRALCRWLAADKVINDILVADWLVVKRTCRSL